MAKIYTLPKGTSLFEEVLTIAAKEDMETALVLGIGGVNKLKLAYFNSSSKRYEEHIYEEFLEVAGIAGNLTLKNRKPFLHLHGTFGRQDMSALAGHIISASVFPLLEVVITPTINRALRRFDEESGLNVIYRTEELSPTVQRLKRKR